MDGLRIGRTVRALRHRLDWRQLDLAARAGVSQGLISLIERGHLEAVAVGKLVAVLRALDADLVLLARWRGGDLDRLLDEAHAGLVGATTALLAAAGWIVEVEITYAIDFERGSIDLLGWFPGTATLLVVEVKSELVSVEETLRRHDAKARLAARIAADRFGWRARTIARLLVLPEGTTPRRRVSCHDAVLRRAYPLRGVEARAWRAMPFAATASCRRRSPRACPRSPAARADRGTAPKSAGSRASIAAIDAGSPVPRRTPQYAASFRMPAAIFSGLTMNQSSSTWL